MKLIQKLCGSVGHIVEGDPIPVGTGQPTKWKDERGNNIAYRMRICVRCGRQVPCSAEDATEKDKLDSAIGAAMNVARAQYGLRPLDWSA